MEPHITIHASKRMKERLGLKSSKRRNRMASLALTRGKVACIEERRTSKGMDHHMILQYQDGLYVFASDLSLVTVIENRHKGYQSKEGMLRSIALKESRKAMAYG